MAVEMAAGGEAQSRVSEDMQWPLSQDEMAAFLMENPGLAEFVVASADETTSPDEYAAAVAVLQREAVSSGNDSVLRAYQRRIRRTLDAERPWILSDVKGGYPSLVNLQLVLWSVQHTRDDLRVMRPGLVGRMAEQHELAGSVPALELAEASAQGPAWSALRGYVLNNHKHQKHFNPGNGHLHAVAQVDLMEGLGILRRLDVRLDDPLRDMMIDQAVVFLDQTRQTGEGYKELPAKTWATLQALIAFREDLRAYRSGNQAVARTLNRPYHGLADPESERRYSIYLIERTRFRNWSNANYIRQFNISAEAAGHKLNKALFDATEEAPSARAQIMTLERVGRYWGIVTQRQNEPGMRQVVQRYSEFVQDVLETYVKDGLPLLVDGHAPRWMRDVVLDSWADFDPKASVFTEQHGSKVSDRGEAGTYMSDWVRRHVVRQGARNELSDGGSSPSNGYSPFRKELGMIVAYRLYVEARQMAYVGAIPADSPILWRAMSRMQQMKNTLKPREFNRMVRLLPRHIWAEYDELPQLPSRRHLRTQRALGTVGVK